MMEEANECDFEVASEMADVETLSKDGPTAALLIAASSDLTESVTTINEKNVEGVISDAMKNEDDSKESMTEKQANVLVDENDPVSAIRPIDAGHVSDKSTELLDDSQNQDSFDNLSKVESKVNPQTASHLFENTGSSESFLGKSQINESFEILDVNKIDFKAQTQANTENNPSENSLGQTTSIDSRLSSQSQLESSFETLSITSYNQSNIGQSQTPGLGSRYVNATTGAPNNAERKEVQLYQSQYPIAGNNSGSIPVASSSISFQGAAIMQESNLASNTVSTMQQQSYGVPTAMQQGITHNASTLYQHQQQSTTPLQAPLFSMTEQNAKTPVYNIPPGTYSPQYNQGTQSIASFSNNSEQYLTYAGSMVSPSIPVADSIAAKNNTGNSYMYTSPISSVIPQYNNSNINAENAVQQPSSQNAFQQSTPAVGLFVPDLYGSSKSAAKNVDIFTPEAPVLPMEAPSPQLTNFGPSNMSGNINYLNNSMQQQSIMQQIPLSLNPSNINHCHEDPGLIEWVRKNMNQDWGEGAKKLGQQIIEKTKHTIEWFGDVIDYGRTKSHLPGSKNATETVLTTLDPGMEEYLNPVMNLAVASVDNKIVQGIRQGFRNVFGHTAVKNHMAQHSLAALPVGFEAAVRAAKEKLDVISNLNFQFNGPYLLVAEEVFLTELQQGRWSCMFCIAVRDVRRRIELYNFSQPVSIPSACVSMAYNRTHPHELQQKFGYSMAIDEAVRLYKPYPVDQDWCYSLNGMKLETMLALASQSLAADYRRELETPIMNNVEAISIIQ